MAKLNSTDIFGSLRVTGDITGDVIGDVTGDVTGDLTGDVTGNVTGDVTGDLTGNASTATWADTVDVNTSASAAWYDVIWHSGDVLYAASGGTVEIYPSTGAFRAQNDITAYYSSDIRLKENIGLIDNALHKISQIRGVNFDWTDEHIEASGGLHDYFLRKNDVGVIAQELEEVLPEAVAQRPDGYKAVRYEKIVPLLIEGIKEQNGIIKNLEEEIKTLREDFHQLINSLYKE